MLHEFLSAEMVQVSEEGVFLGFLGAFFLGHKCTILQSAPGVNSADLKPKTKTAQTALHFVQGKKSVLARRKECG